MKCNNIPKPNTITQLLVALMFASVFGADSAFGQTVHNDNASRLPKAENKVADTENVRHLLHQAQNLAPLASTTQATVIIGPKVGYEGAKYSLQSAQEGDVTWSSNNPDVASINASGILTVKGRGGVVLTANYKKQRYNQTILVGIPRFILSTSPQTGGYKVVAKCIDSEYKNYQPLLNEVLRFKWGIKYPDENIRWSTSDKSSLTIQTQALDKDITVFLQVADVQGNKSALQHISVHPQDVYASDYTTFYIDSEGNLYDFKKRYDLYESSRVFIDYKPNLPKKYEGREWMPITAIVLSPQKGNKEISMYGGGPLVCDILSEEEYEFIRNKSNDNQRYNYMLMLLNDEQKVIQYIPISFIFKTTL